MRKDIINIPQKKITSDLEVIQEFLVSIYILRNIKNQNLPLKKFISDFEKKLIKNTLLITNGNLKSTASILGIKHTTLFEKIKRYNIKKIKKSLGNSM